MGVREGNKPVIGCRAARDRHSAHVTPFPRPPACLVASRRPRPPTHRWEKVLVPTQRLYRPLLARLYFKLGVLHEMQGLVDRSVLCYQEVRRRTRGFRPECLQMCSLRERACSRCSKCAALDDRGASHSLGC